VHPSATFLGRVVVGWYAYILFEGIAFAISAMNPLQGGYGMIGEDVISSCEDGQFGRA
jgi:hypothetical protein